MKPRSTKLLGCLDRRNSDLITPAVLVSFGDMTGVRGAGSNFFLFKLKSAALNCGVVFIMVSTEQSLIRIRTALGTVARAVIGRKQNVFEAFDPVTGAPIRNGILCAHVRNLCLCWLQSFICCALARGRTIPSLIQQSVRMCMCGEAT